MLYDNLSIYIGNLPNAGRTLACDFKNAWIIAEKYHDEAERAGTISYDFVKSDSWLACPGLRNFEPNIKRIGYCSIINSHFLSFIFSP